MGEDHNTAKRARLYLPLAAGDHERPPAAAEPGGSVRADALSVAVRRAIAGRVAAGASLRSVAADYSVSHERIRRIAARERELVAVG